MARSWDARRLIGDRRVPGEARGGPGWALRPASCRRGAAPGGSGASGTGYQPPSAWEAIPTIARPQAAQGCLRMRAGRGAGANSAEASAAGAPADLPSSAQMTSVHQDIDSVLFDEALHRRGDRAGRRGDHRALRGRRSDRGLDPEGVVYLRLGPHPPDPDPPRARLRLGVVLRRSDDLRGAGDQLFSHGRDRRASPAARRRHP